MNAETMNWPNWLPRVLWPRRACPCCNSVQFKSAELRSLDWTIGHVCSSAGSLHVLLAALLLVFPARRSMSILISDWIHTSNDLLGRLMAKHTSRQLKIIRSLHRVLRTCRTSRTRRPSPSSLWLLQHCSKPTTEKSRTEAIVNRRPTKADPARQTRPRASQPNSPHWSQNERKEQARAWTQAKNGETSAADDSENLSSETPTNMQHCDGEYPQKSPQLSISEVDRGVVKRRKSVNLDGGRGRNRIRWTT